MSSDPGLMQAHRDARPGMQKLYWPLLTQSPRPSEVDQRFHRQGVARVGVKDHRRYAIRGTDTTYARPSFADVAYGSQGWAQSPCLHQYSVHADVTQYRLMPRCSCYVRPLLVSKSCMMADNADVLSDKEAVCNWHSPTTRLAARLSTEKRHYMSSDVSALSSSTWPSNA